MEWILPGVSARTYASWQDVLPALEHFSRAQPPYFCAQADHELSGSVVSKVLESMDVHGRLTLEEFLAIADVSACLCSLLPALLEHAHALPTCLVSLALLQTWKDLSFCCFPLQSFLAALSL